MSMMTSSKPYLIRAIYEWIVENKCTPYIVIDAEHENVQVPTDYINDGRIVLNISPTACRGLHLENDRVVFSARFSGVAMQIHAPPQAVVAVYAKENGRGMVFSKEEEEQSGEGGEGVPAPDVTAAGEVSGPRRAKPALKVIK